MRLDCTIVAAAFWQTALAFSDSSPWILLSTSALAKAPNPNQLQTSSEVVEFTKEFLSECPTDKYLIVTQPGLSAADLRRNDGCAMPHLCRAIDDASVKGKYIVAEIVGNPALAGFREHIVSSCNRKGKTVEVDQAPLESLSNNRAESLARNDGALSRGLEPMMTGDSYTVLLYATPQEPAYDSEFIEPLHTEMKRSYDNGALKKRANQTERDTRPLFEKYQFFTPGLFMGIIVTLVLFSILGAGIRGLASLQVSYGAFDKDMGPAAHKKQQ